MKRRVASWMVAATVAVFGSGLSGCGGGRTISTKTTVAPSEKPVIKDATREELLLAVYRSGLEKLAAAEQKLAKELPVVELPLSEVSRELKMNEPA